MTLTLICTVIFIYFIFNDLIPVYQKEEKKVAWTYMVLFVMSYVLHILITFEVKLPSPAAPLRKLVMTVFGIGE